MATWTNEELDKIGAAEELEIAPVRRDGTLRNPVTIWVVRHGNGLYVRSYRGQDGRTPQKPIRHHLISENHVHLGQDMPSVVSWRG
jgi:hypothetical protein